MLATATSQTVDRSVMKHDINRKLCILLIILMLFGVDKKCRDVFF